MLSINSAREMVKEHLAHASDDFEVYADPILQGEYGWVFGYQSKHYIHTENVVDALAGNAPLLVDKNEGSLHVLGTGQWVEYYVENYIRFGDPHKTAGSKVQLVSRCFSVQTIDAIRCVRDHTAIGLTGAKLLVEECISGGSPSVECHTVEANLPAN